MNEMQRCAVLGKPIAHSLSPVLHEAAYRALGLGQWSYTKQEVAESELPSFLASLDPSWRGLSLTMPLKRTIAPFGIARNQWARELGVANTVVFDWDSPSTSAGRDLPAMALYNTDVYGIVRAFHDAFRTHVMTLPAQPHAVILGNGNTATSALAACITMGCSQITVAARHPNRSTALIELGAAHGVTVRSISLEDCLPALEQCNIAISTIPGTRRCGCPAFRGACTTHPWGIARCRIRSPSDRTHGGLARSWRPHHRRRADAATSGRGASVADDGNNRGCRCG